MKKEAHLIVLAAGLSNRFEYGNKLMANFRGVPLATYSSRLWNDLPQPRRIAVVPSGSGELEQIFLDSGWTTIHNDKPARGQSSSVRLGLAEAVKQNATKIIVALADMPLISDKHLDNVYAKLTDHDAVMSSTGDYSHPPSGFTREVFPRLKSLNGDEGAKSIFRQIERRALVPVSGSAVRDVDTVEDMKQLEQLSKQNA